MGSDMLVLFGGYDMKTWGGEPEKAGRVLRPHRCALWKERRDAGSEEPGATLHSGQLVG